MEIKELKQIKDALYLKERQFKWEMDASSIIGDRKEFESSKALWVQAKELQKEMNK